MFSRLDVYRARGNIMTARLALYLRSSIFLFCLFCGSTESIHGQGPYSKQATISETAGKIRLVANDSRPLAQALDALQQKYGWRVDYEYPQYISKLDVIEPKSSPDKSSSPDSQHRVPSGGALVVEFGAATAPNAAPDEQKTLQLIIDSYNRSGNPGQFELRKDKDREAQVFDVVGTAAHDSRGKVAQQPVLLDSPLTIAAQERSFSDTVDLICQMISDKSGVKIILGVHPLGLDRTNVTIGGKELPARAYLFRAMEATSRKLVWRLLYDPESSSYFLNVHQVKLP
jgi:hypothetical protein